MEKISILCADTNSNYKQIPNLDVWDRARNAYNFTGSNPVITHAPCSQWSRLRGLAHENQLEKDLAFFCLEKVKNNGGIFEHPEGSIFFKTAGIKPTIIIDQGNFGFPAQKRTWLYFSRCNPLPLPPPVYSGYQISVNNMSSKRRSETTFPLIRWLVHSIYPTFTIPQIF